MLRRICAVQIYPREFVLDHRSTMYIVYIYIFFLSHFYFPASGPAVVTGRRCRPFFPPVLAFNFYRAWGSAIPLLVDFSSSVTVANSRSRAFRKSSCAQEKVPADLYDYALGGARTHETDLYQARGLSDTPPGRPVHVRLPLGNAIYIIDHIYMHATPTSARGGRGGYSLLLALVI